MEGSLQMNFTVGCALVIVVLLPWPVQVGIQTEVNSLLLSMQLLNCKGKSLMWVCAAETRTSHLLQKTHNIWKNNRRYYLQRVKD